MGLYQKQKRPPERCVTNNLSGIRKKEQRGWLDTNNIYNKTHPVL